MVKENDIESTASSSNTVLLAEDLSSQGIESVWGDIDFSERCLVSARYQDAAGAAIRVLRALCERPSGDEICGGDGSIEFASMVESAGMVYLQALNEMGRPSEIFTDLTSIFKSVHRVPYSLILTGLCLQVPMNLNSTSQAALREYLSSWTFSESSTDSLMVKAGKVSLDHQMTCKSSLTLKNSRRSSCLFYLAKTDYIQLAEIYVIEVLAKLEKNSAAALLWIKRAAISEEDKQVILEKLQVASQSQQRTINHNSSKQRTEALASGSVNKCFQETRAQISDEASVDLDKTVSIGDSDACGGSVPSVSGGSKFRAVQREYGIYSRFPFVRTVITLVELMMIRLGALPTSNWRLRYHRLCQSRALVTGALTSVFVYVLLRKRQYLKRLLRSMLSIMRRYLGDIWQLAFTVHLSPFAAVEPLPSGRTL